MWEGQNRNKYCYSCNKITNTWIQIFRPNWNVFSQILAIKWWVILNPIDSSEKKQVVQIPKSQEIFVKSTIADHSYFDKRCSNAHFVPFLLYYYCTTGSQRSFGSGEWFGTFFWRFEAKWKTF